MTNPITVKMLRRLGACESQVQKFRELFGVSVEPTVELAIEHAQTFDFDWAGRNMLSPELYTEYQSVREKALAKYYRIEPFSEFIIHGDKLVYQTTKAAAFANLYIFGKEDKMTKNIKWGTFEDWFGEMEPGDYLVIDDWGGVRQIKLDTRTYLTTVSQICRPVPTVVQEIDAWVYELSLPGGPLQITNWYDKFTNGTRLRLTFTGELGEGTITGEWV